MRLPLWSSLMLWSVLASTAFAQEPAPAAAPAAPPRWLLMDSLQGTWPGWLLDSHRIQVYGWTEVGFATGSDQHSNLPLGFDYRPNKLDLQQNWLRIDMPVVTSGTTEPTYGFRSDWILPGSDYLFTLPRGIFNSQFTANNGQPETYGIDPIQFYGEADFPTIAQGMDVKVGRFYAQFGVESIDAPSNALFSHSYSSIYNPTTQTGIVTTTQLTAAWSVQAGIVMGSDIFFDAGMNPTFIGSVRWANPDQRNGAQFSVVVGSGKYDATNQFSNPDVFDLVFTHKFNPRLTANVEAAYAFTADVPDIGTADWYGVANYLTYNLTPRLNETTRLEFFDDAQGFRTGSEGLYMALTQGLSFSPRREITIRPEIRYDYNTESRPFEDKHWLVTAATDVIFRW